MMMMMMMMMMILINTSSDFDQYFLNCYFKKKLFDRIFLFHYLTYNLLGIELHDFSRLDASDLIIQVIGLKS